MFKALPSLTSLDGFDRQGKEVNPPGEEDDEEEEVDSEEDGPGLEYLQKEILVCAAYCACHRACCTPILLDIISISYKKRFLEPFDKTNVENGYKHVVVVIILLEIML